jgi:hypothetical protein
MAKKNERRDGLARCPCRPPPPPPPPPCAPDVSPPLQRTRTRGKLTIAVPAVPIELTRLDDPPPPKPRRRCPRGARPSPSPSSPSSGLLLVWTSSASFVALNAIVAVVVVDAVVGRFSAFDTAGRPPKRSSGWSIVAIIRDLF